MTSQTLIQLKHLKKDFGKNEVVKDISLDIYDGEFLTLLGPSGCGKTTILRMIGGFETPTAGEILLDGEDLVHVPPNKRQINTVFQSYALFPHLSVRDNIAYGMKMQKVPPAEIKERVDEMLSLTNLESLAGRYPSQLSGGQQQRVAIARSLVNRPRLLLLDEPLGALDLQLRKQMQIELKRLQKQLGTTYVYVTHDQEEAMTMSDRIVVMNAGAIEQVGSAKEIYTSPATRFVSQFLGDTNLFQGIYTEKTGHGYFTIQGIDFEISKQEQAPALLSVRPEHLQILPASAGGLSGEIAESVFMGNVFRIGIRLADDNLYYSLSKEACCVGQKVSLAFSKEHTKGIIL